MADEKPYAVIGGCYGVAQLLHISLGWIFTLNAKLHMANYVVVFSALNVTCAPPTDSAYSFCF